MTIRSSSKLIPKHARVKQVLLDRIARGEYPPGSLLPSEHELVKMFGVGQQTVIRSLNDLRAEGVLRRHRGRGTFVQEIPASEGAVGILRHFDETAYWRSVYTECVQHALLCGLNKHQVQPRFYHTFSPNPKGDFKGLGQKVAADARRGLLRWLIVIGGYDADTVESALAPFGVTVIGTHSERVLTRFNFGYRLAQAAEAGLEYLLQRGLKKIAILASRGTHVPMLQYTEAYLNTMERHQIAIRPGWMRAQQDASPLVGHEEFKKLWGMNDRPEAVIVFDDIMAQGATRAMVELGVRIPEELQVMVLVNRGSGLTYAVPFTSLEVDPGEVGAAGAELVLSLLRGKTVDKPQVWVSLKPRIRELTHRESLAGLEAPPATVSV